MKQYLCLALLAVAGLLVGCQQTQTTEPPVKPAEQKAAAPAPAPAAMEKITEIIVDNADPAFRSEGTWDAGEAAQNFKASVVFASGGDQATAKAIWTPVIVVPGTYEVLEWHGEDPNSDHASDAPFTINYDGGSKTVPVNLRENIGKWNTFGTFKFAAGTRGNVTLTNKANGNVIADAIKFVYKGK